MLGLILACLLLPFGADPVPAPAPAQATSPATSPIKVEAVKRSGYSLVALTSTDAKLTIKQSEFIAIGNGTTIEITSDQSGNSLVVTSPPAGTVIVYVVALMSDGSLTQPPPIEIPAAGTTAPTTTPVVPGANPVVPPPTPAAPSATAPLAGQTGLRVSLVLNLAAPGKAEQDLIALGSPTAESIKQALGGLGNHWGLADVNSAIFQQSLAAARKINPQVPAINEAPFLFIERMSDRGFVAAYHLRLSPDPRANANAILGLFGAKL